NSRAGEHGSPLISSQFLLFPDQVFATLRAHARGVGSLAGNIEALARFVSAGLPTDRNGHLAGQDDVGRDVGVLVGRIVHVRPVFPNVYVIEPFVLQLLRQLLFVHYTESPGAFSESSVCRPFPTESKREWPLSGTSEAIPPLYLRLEGTPRSSW